MNYKEFFGGMFCINLDECTDRWQHCKVQFDRLGLEVERIPGARDDNGICNAFGCAMAHKKCISIAKERKYPNIVVFEDDVVFLQQDTSKLEISIGELPAEWDILYFGVRFGARTKTIKFSENLSNVYKSPGTSSLCYNSRVYDEILNYDISTMEIDGYTQVIQKRGKVFCVEPYFCTDTLKFGSVRVDSPYYGKPQNV